MMSTKRVQGKGCDTVEAHRANGSKSREIELHASFFRLSYHDAKEALI